jgi:hypothetical protein
MDTSVITALAALAGAAIGGLTSVVAILLIERAQAREQRLAHYQLRRMRVLSSKTVVDSADQILKTIINSYLEPNKSFPELRQMAHSGLIDPLRNFSEACRSEAKSLDFGPPG